VNSCEFSPTGSNYTEIDRTLPQNLEIRLNDYADTVQVWGSANFSFQFNLEGRGVRRKTIFLDGDSLLDLGNRTEFFFHSSDYSDGSHRLRIDVIADAGTGSLADKIGVEVLLLRREWILLIDNAPPQAVAVTSIEPENGRLRIQWEKMSNLNFKDTTFCDPNATFLALLNGWLLLQIAIKSRCLTPRTSEEKLITE
jgi:hypothetical protein